MQRQDQLSIKKFLLLIIPLVAIWIFQDLQRSKQKKQYLHSLNVHFEGVVKFVKTGNGFNGFGIIGVDLISTNKAQILPPKNLNSYYCLLKNGKAELYQGGASYFSVGDTVNVDTENNIITLRKLNGEVSSSDIIVYDNEFFWKFVKKNTKI